MTSVVRDFAQIPENKLYLATAPLTLLTSSGAASQVTTASGTVLRDMGTTVVDQATGDFLRKVQIVPTGGDAVVYGSGYIKFGGATYGGDGLGTSAVVRLN